MALSSPGSRPTVLVDAYPRAVSRIFSAEDRKRLEGLAHVVWHDDDAPASDDFIDRWLPGATALIGQSALSRSRLERAPHLRAVVNVESNFLANVDYEECFRRGIHVLSTAPVFSRPVAEMALGLTLALARHIPRGDQWVRSGQEILFDEGVDHDAFLVSGKTVGLVGLGNVGRDLVRLLEPFRCLMLGYDPWLHNSTIQDLGVVPVGVDELFERSRVVFLLSAATTENEGRIGRRLLERLPAGAVVVLVSRAAIVDWQDLLDAAEAGRIRAAIDVFPEEPIPERARERQTANTLLSAHRAGNVPEIWPVMGQMLVDDLELIFRGLAPQRCQRAERETVGKLRSKPVA